MISFENVNLNVKNIDILNNLNFFIRRNSTVCFVGNRYCGKTSILKIIAGIIKNYNGDIYINKKNIKNNNYQNVAMVFDKIEANTELNVYEYLEFYCKLYDKDKEFIKNYIDIMLKKFSLMAYKYTNLEILDVETCKMIQLIRAMINDPDIILFDNLFSMENFDFNERMLTFIKELLGKKTIIFASRSLKYLDNLCDFIGILDTGNLIAFGNKNDVYKTLNINNRIEIRVLSKIKDAIKILYEDDRISNVSYENNRIVFTLNGDKNSENEILKNLINNDVSVFSYKREDISFKQLFGNYLEN